MSTRNDYIARMKAQLDAWGTELHELESRAEHARADLKERYRRSIEELRDMNVVITVAGMEGTLPSVVAGLVPGLVIAVPVATGYGVAANGITALNSALASCAPGLVVVNVDNGYGAGCAALRMLNVMQRRPPGGDG